MDAILYRFLRRTVKAVFIGRAARDCELFYWSDRNKEVDCVVRRGRRVVAIEVKSGRAPVVQPELEAFSAAFRPNRKLLIGGDRIPIATFLARPVQDWVSA